jgi:hypothetical protein
LISDFILQGVGFLGPFAGSNYGAYDDVSLKLGSGISANLSGSVSDDGLPEGSFIQTLWEQVSGPAAILNDPLSLHTSFSATVPGTYVFRLKANDGELEGQDEVS